MTFTLPNGNVIAVRSNGSMANYIQGDLNSEKLTKNGDLVFCPDDNDWGSGYYLFHPHIYKDDPSVTVKVLYWVD